MHPQNSCDAYQKMVDDYKKFIHNGILLDGGSGLLYFL